MDLTIEIFNFRVGSLGSVRLSDPVNSGPSVGKTTIAVTSETSVVSSSEVNSPVSIKPKKESTVEELDEIMENLDLDKSSGYWDMSSDENLDKSHSYLEEDSMVCYGNVSNNSEDTWKSGLELYSNEQTILSSGSSGDIHSQYQVYAIIDETSEEYDANNNPIINLGNVRRGANHMAERDTKETIAARVKIQLTIVEWETIRGAVNNGAVISIDARREVLLGYNYSLHRQAQQLEKEKREIRKRQESVSAASKAFQAERNNASHTNNARHHRHGSRIDNLGHTERRSLSQNLDSSFLSVDDRGNIIPKTPEAILIAAHAYLFTTQPTLETLGKAYIGPHCRD
jgi:hypothetical protein